MQMVSQVSRIFCGGYSRLRTTFLLRCLRIRGSNVNCGGGMTEAGTDWGMACSSLSSLPVGFGCLSSPRLEKLCLCGCFRWWLLSVVALSGATTIVHMYVCFGLCVCIACHMSVLVTVWIEGRHLVFIFAFLQVLLLEPALSLYVWHGH